MPEYIDREKVYDLLVDKKDEIRGGNSYRFLDDAAKAEYNKIEDIEDLVSDIPAADVVPVVRCKECVHCLKGNSESSYHLCMRRSIFPQEVHLEDFCSFGERWNDNAAD